MSVCILQANLGNFDTPVDPVEQSIPSDFHRWTDDDFPPIVGLTPRLQYRIPKTYGWEMKPGYDHYIWLDGGMSLQDPDCVKWYLEQLGDRDIALFKHPYRSTIQEEVEHIEEHLRLGKPYITPRYKGGLHREQLNRILSTPYKDKTLFASTAFIYRNVTKVHFMMKNWLFSSVRYFTCDQVALPYLLWKHGLKVRTLTEPIYHTKYLTMVGHHK